jgi:hypothetical protein
VQKARVSLFASFSLVLSSLLVASEIPGPPVLTQTPSTFAASGKSHRGLPPVLLPDGDRAAVPADASTGLSFVGNVSYQISGSTVDLKADQIQSTRSTTSGTLALWLWATQTVPVFGQSIDFQLLATYQMSELPAGSSFTSVDSGSVPFTAPSDGTWYITMALEEYANGPSGTAWYYADFVTFNNTLTWPPPVCLANSANLCLNSARFRVSVAWQAPAQGTSGSGTAIPFSSDSGYFWFFNSSNIELVVKVLDGTGINGYFWVFYGSLSNVQYTIYVTDTQTGITKIYTNPNGSFGSVGDTSAFAASGSPVGNVNVSGTWNASITAGTIQGSATFTLNQVGTAVTGTVVVSDGAAGNVSGSVQGQSFSFTFVELIPCSGTFYGVGVVNSAGNQMNGSYSGSDCTVSFNASFFAQKQ